MKILYPLIRRLFIVALLIVANPLASSAESKTDDSQEKLDVVLLLDASASMRITDPLRLRDQGAALFLQFLKKGDRLGIIEFSDTSKVLLPLTNFDESKLNVFSETLTKAGNSGIYTDIASGIAGAVRLLAEGQRSGASQLVILLSDGKMDPSPSVGNASDLTKKLLEETLPDLRSRDVKIHTLAFSSEADRDLLSQIALGTDGVSWFTPDVDKVHKSFADLFLVVKKPQVVPISKKGLTIDQEVDEATFYADREEGKSITIITPSEKRLTVMSKPDDVRWYEGKQFDVITIVAPETGLWQIAGISSDEAFATVLTNLKLITDWPANVYAGDETVVGARLSEGNKPVSLGSMSGVTTFGLQITPTDRVTEPVVKELLLDNGEDGDQEAGDGTFSKTITIDEPGEYRLQVRAKSPTFTREQNIPFRVRPPLLTLEIGKSVPSVGESEHAEVHDLLEPVPAFHVTLSSDVQSLKNIEVELIAHDDEGEESHIPLIRSKENPLVFESVVTNLPHSGEFKLKAELAGKTKKGIGVTGKSKALHYKYEGKKAAEVHEKATPQKIEAPPSLLPFLIVVIIVNVIAGAAAMFIFKPSEESGEEVPDYTPPPALEGIVNDLKNTLEQVEVDLDDPRLARNDSARNESGINQLGA